MPPLLVGDAVRMKLPGEQKWSLGVCTRSLGRRSHEVEVEGRPIAETDANCALLQNLRPGTVLRK